MENAERKAEQDLSSILLFRAYASSARAHCIMTAFRELIKLGWPIYR